MSATTNIEEETKGIRLNVPRRMMIVPLVGMIVGSAIGIMRGGRAASLRFLAENAHRAPRTVEGWYFYKKTKNYKVMWEGLKGGVKEGARVGGLAGVYVGIEEGMGRIGAGEWKELGGGIGTGLLFSVVCEYGCVVVDKMLIGHRSIACERGEKDAFGRMRIWGVYEMPPLYKISRCPVVPCVQCSSLLVMSSPLYVSFIRSSSAGQPVR